MIGLYFTPNPLKQSGYRLLQRYEPCILHMKYIYKFYRILRIYSDYLPKQH
jgi:hypothetical protein